MPAASRVDPGPSSPDGSDWTWVLTRPCPDCGFDPDDIRGDGVSTILRDAAGRFLMVLERPDAAARPAVGVWSPLEYACHVGDVCDVMRGRLEQIVAGEGGLVRFPDWNQDEAAIAAQYWRAEPAQVGDRIATAFELAAQAYAAPTAEQWSWPAERSNGSTFTAATLSRYFVHDIHHHLWDVSA
ncbi:methyltransferase type 12 [Humibacillus sp. DSM 29435]|uniref:DinB family protein n=1 Tax=Humibacillus sp. DSM 29435 TaxID=1869167 RepID=UPI0008730E22|nr:DinB family protein [Humibacillus sp. DSM 29435]OFE17889.1 methyltransferase type 12 [Humibacillus sp. DSM 29435]